MDCRDLLQSGVAVLLSNTPWLQARDLEHTRPLAALHSIRPNFGSPTINRISRPVKIMFFLASNAFHIMATRSQANKVRLYLRHPLDCGACDLRDDRRVPANSATRGTKYMSAPIEEEFAMTRLLRNREREAPLYPPSPHRSILGALGLQTDGRTDGLADADDGKVD